MTHSSPCPRSIRGCSRGAMAEAALARAPYDPHAHDAYARVLVACDLLDLAADAWETARTLHPGHVGAIKGLGFLAFRRGDLLAAERLLSDALSVPPTRARRPRWHVCELPRERRRKPRRHLRKIP